jgi:hypothetical protein
MIEFPDRKDVHRTDRSISAWLVWVNRQIPAENALLEHLPWLVRGDGASTSLETGEVGSSRHKHSRRRAVAARSV